MSDNVTSSDVENQLPVVLRTNLKYKNVFKCIFGDNTTEVGME